MSAPGASAACAHLQQHGYVVIPGALSAEYSDRALAGIDAFKSKYPEAVVLNANEFGYLYRVVNLHLVVDALADAFSHNKALPVCDRFFGEASTLYTSLYYERGSEQALHRDTPYFCTRPADRYLGAWLALDDVDSENGPLRIVPRSHQLPAIDLRALACEVFPDSATIPPISDVGWNAYQAQVQRQCDEHDLQPVELHVKLGDMIIWHPSMFHGGAPHHLMERSRRSLVMHVTPKGTPVHQLDLFFNPDRQIPAKAAWRYYKHHGREIARFRQIDFGHSHTIPVRRLRWPLF
jgi:phytanoyl-CoA hydroxylase